MKITQQHLAAFCYTWGIQPTVYICWLLCLFGTCCTWYRNLYITMHLFNQDKYTSETPLTHIRSIIYLFIYLFIFFLTVYLDHFVCGPGVLSWEAFYDLEQISSVSIPASTIYYIYIFKQSFWVMHYFTYICTHSTQYQDIYIIIEHHRTVQIFDWAWWSVLLQVIINKSVFIIFDYLSIYYYTPVSHSPDFTMGSNESKIKAIIIALVPRIFRSYNALEMLFSSTNLLPEPQAFCLYTMFILYMFPHSIKVVSKTCQGRLCVFFNFL